MEMADFNSATYPYDRVIQANTLRGAETIPHQMLLYLMDLPDSAGYIPADDNERPRVRLAKYLWHDGPNPLGKSLPTPDEKLSLLFDPEHPALETDELRTAHPKGYRLFFQKIIGQSQTDAMTGIRCYIGKVMSRSASDYFIDTIGIQFEISVNVNLETNTRTNAYQRSFDIEQCIREALNGVNMTGIGTVSFSRTDHPDNGSGILYDEATNVGRWLCCSINWADGAETGQTLCL